MPTSNKYAIIVAGGSGKRMDSILPKQFIEIKGKPILMHSILAFFCFDNTINISVVLPESQINTWKKLCVKHSFLIAHTILKGGSERFFSVKNGLKTIPKKGIVAIHDGVRPLVSSNTLSRCFEKTKEKGNAIPVIDVHETLREVDVEQSHTVPRNNYKLVQTPQCFDISLIKKAFEQEYIPSFTDDASVAEASGISIHLVEGNRENIKITTPFDLKLAETLFVDK